MDKEKSLGARCWEKATGLYLRERALIALAEYPYTILAEISAELASLDNYSSQVRDNNTLAYI